MGSRKARQTWGSVSLLGHYPQSSPGGRGAIILLLTGEKLRHRVAITCPGTRSLKMAGAGWANHSYLSKPTYWGWGGGLQIHFLMAC